MENTRFALNNSYTFTHEGAGYFYDVGLINEDQNYDIIFFRDSHMSLGAYTQFSIYYYNNSTKEYDPIDYRLDNINHRFYFGYLSDFNSDGKLDVVTSSSHECMVFLQENNLFKTTPDYYFTATESMLKIIDYNFDGIKDLIKLNHYESIELFFQDSNGTLSNPVVFNQPYYYEDIIFYDYNNDTILDIIVSSQTYHEYKICIYLMEKDSDNNGYYDTFDHYYEELKKSESNTI